MLEKVDIIRKLELELAQSKTEAPQLLENDSLAESFSSVQKENIELLQKLQKAELELAKYREKSLNISDNSQIVIPDKEVIANTIKERPVTSEDKDKRIAELDAKLFEMKKLLQSAKEECLKRLVSHLESKQEDIKAQFYKTDIIAHALKRDRVTGWNNKVKQCLLIQFSGREFVLIEEKYRDPEEQGEFYVVDRDLLSEEAYRYLRTFVEASDSLMHEDISAADEQT